MNQSPGSERTADPGGLRPGKYPRGSKTVEAILDAALQVLVEEGSSAFTLRRIAARCNLQVGNVSRHFPRKEMLVQVLLHELLTSSEKLIKHGIHDAKLPPEEALALVITGTLDEIGTKRITNLFTELWAMSNHNAFVAERVEATYRYVNDLVGSFVKQLNPSLNADQIETVSLFINATLEGSTVVSGYGRPWESKMPALKKISAKWLIDMVKNITPDDVETVNAR
jgi:AcrR family transcriptional regulator